MEVWSVDTGRRLWRTFQTKKRDEFWGLPTFFPDGKRILVRREGALVAVDVKPHPHLLARLGARDRAHAVAIGFRNALIE